MKDKVSTLDEHSLKMKVNGFLVKMKVKERPDEDKRRNVWVKICLA